LTNIHLYTIIQPTTVQSDDSSATVVLSYAFCLPSDLTVPERPLR
jgi:hypothetical protein